MAERLRARRRDSYAGEHAPVFASVAGTELGRPNLAGRVLKPAAFAAGFVVAGDDGEPTVWVSFHTFRHTCASLLFDASRNVKQVAEWLGHADPAFTLRTYVHLMDEELGDADFLDAAVTARLGRVNAGSTQRPEQPQTEGRSTSRFRLCRAKKAGPAGEARKPCATSRL